MTAPDLTPVADTEYRPSDDFTTYPTVVVNVTYPNAGVDRPTTYGMSFRDDDRGRKLAARFAAAVNAGHVMYDARIETDVNGDTYVAAASKVMGRYANTQLKRLGF